MRNRFLVLAVLLVTGCAGIRGVRTTTGVIQNVPDNYEAQWSAAKSLAEIAESATKPEKRKAAAKDGIVYARRACDLKTEGVEGHYYYALNVGWLADADRSYGLDAVGEMEKALKRAIELDEKFDHAGPLRMLGILHLRTPGPPVSIGSPRKGLRFLQRAVEAFPEYAENYLYLAEALRDTGKTEEARAALEKVMKSENAEWKAAGQKLLATLKPAVHKEN